jgi:cell division protein FtsW (lipid II flippase)
MKNYKDEPFLITLILLFGIGLIFIYLSIPAKNKTKAKKCYSYDLSYDPIGMGKIIRTNVEETPCLK